MSQEKTIAITRSKDDSEEFIQLITIKLILGILGVLEY